MPILDVQVFAYSACTSASRNFRLIGRRRSVARHHRARHHRRARESSTIPRIDTIISFIQDVIQPLPLPSRLRVPSVPRAVFRGNSRPCGGRRRPPSHPHASSPPLVHRRRDVTTIIAISLPPRARVERRRVTRVSSLDRLDRSRVASYLLTDSGSVLDGVSRAFSMDGWTCVCVSLPIGCVGRMDGWMRWMR